MLLLGYNITFEEAEKRAFEKAKSSYDLDNSTDYFSNYMIPSKWHSDFVYLFKGFRMLTQDSDIKSAITDFKSKMDYFLNKQNTVINIINNGSFVITNGKALSEISDYNTKRLNFKIEYENTLKYIQTELDKLINDYPKYELLSYIVNSVSEFVSKYTQMYSNTLQINFDKIYDNTLKYYKEFISK